MTNSQIQFFVEGTPKPQGSKRAMMPRGARHPVVIESAGQPLKDWRACVSYTAAQQQQRIDGPVSVWLTFLMRRPKSHYGTGKNAGVIKGSAPSCHTQRPDIDKLTRAVLDGLTGVVMGDDSEVCELYVKKQWSDDRSGCLVVVGEYGERRTKGT